MWAAGGPVSQRKIEGPSKRLTFLDIEIDTVKLQTQLPIDKLTHLRQELTVWQSRKSCIRKEIEHLIGILNSICLQGGDLRDEQE